MRFSRIDRNLATRAATLALSAWVAFAIASVWHVQHDYWAAMPVWVVAQASRGVLLERALFRVVGTLWWAPCWGQAPGSCCSSCPCIPTCSWHSWACGWPPAQA